MTKSLSFAEKSKVVRAMQQRSEWRGRASVRVLRNYTIENLAPLVRYQAAQSGLNVEMGFSDFDTFEQEVLDSRSVTNTGHHDIVLLSLWLDGLLPPGRSFDFSPDEVWSRVENLIEELRLRISGVIVVTNFLPPLFCLGGSRLEKRPEAVGMKLAALNARLTAHAAGQNRVHVIDFHRLVATVGHQSAFDSRFWYAYRAPLRNELIDLLAAEVAALAVALKFGAKKVLVLDCDNTLWGGIVGEEGLNGIQLNPHDYPGVAFYDFHRQILQLKQRGVILAICSKNNAADARAVFQEHPHSLLRMSDFAASCINWEDKVTNIRALARELNLGLESFVFVDDSPVECDHVRSQLSEVTVLQVPLKLFELHGLLRDYRGFDNLEQSEEDARRTEMYQAEALRKQSRGEHRDLQSYLSSLKLVAEIRPPTAAEIGRVAQLTQKTNQFNLTTRRYTEGDIERLCTSADSFIFAMKVNDCFGDYGLTGLAIVTCDGPEASVDTFLISCRVLGRQLEFALLGSIIVEARRLFPSAAFLRASFLPTQKNQQVADFYDRAGFISAGDGRYSFDLAKAFSLEPAHVTLVR